MNFRRYRGSMVCVLLALFCSATIEAAVPPCVSTTAIEQVALGTTSAKYYYMECAVITDGLHPFLVRLSNERRAALTERLKDKTAQMLACTANPRDPARTGLKKKEMVVLAGCKPARVGEVWTLP